MAAYYASVIEDIYRWTGENMAHILPESGDEDASAPLGLREALMKVSRPMSHEGRQLRLQMISKYYLGQLNTLFNLPADGTTIENHDALIRLIFSENKSTTVISVKDGSALSLNSYLAAINEVRYADKIIRPFIDYSITNKRFDMYQALRKSFVQWSQFDQAALSALLPWKVIPSAGNLCYTLASAETYKDQAPQQDKEYRIHSNLIRFDTWPDRILFWKTKPSALPHLIMNDANHRFLYRSAFTYDLLVPAFRNLLQNSGANLLDITRLTDDQADSSFVHASMFTRSDISASTVKWKHVYDQSFVEMYHTKRNILLNVSDMQAFAWEHKTFFPEITRHNVGTKDLEQDFAMVTQNRIYATYTSELDPSTTSGLLMVRRNMWPPQYPRFDTILSADQKLAGILYFFDLTKLQTSIQQFSWWRPKTNQYNDKNLSDKQVGLRFPDTIELDLVCQKASDDDYNYPDWFILYFKALIGYIRDYEVETSGKTSNTFPRPLLLVRLDTLNHAGTVTDINMCFYLRRYLAFALACPQTVIDEAVVRNNLFAPDFLIDSVELIHTQSSGANKDDYVRNSISDLENAYWLLRPLPTLDELWTMFVMYTGQFWLSLPTSMNASIFDAVKLLESSSSIGHCDLMTKEGKSVCKSLARNTSKLPATDSIFGRSDVEWQRIMSSISDPDAVRNMAVPYPAIYDETITEPIATKNNHAPPIPIKRNPGVGMTEVQRENKKDTHSNPLRLAAARAMKEIEKKKLEDELTGEHPQFVIYSKGIKTAKKALDTSKLIVPIDLWLLLPSDMKQMLAEYSRIMDHITVLGGYESLARAIELRGHEVRSTLYVGVDMWTLLSNNARQSIQLAALNLLEDEETPPIAAVKAYTQSVIEGLKELSPQPTFSIFKGNNALFQLIPDRYRSKKCYPVTHTSLFLSQEALKGFDVALPLSRALYDSMRRDKDLKTELDSIGNSLYRGRISDYNDALRRIDGYAGQATNDYMNAETILQDYISDVIPNSLIAISTYTWSKLNYTQQSFLAKCVNYPTPLKRIVDYYTSTHPPPKDFKGIMGPQGNAFTMYITPDIMNFMPKPQESAQNVSTPAPTMQDKKQEPQFEPDFDESMFTDDWDENKNGTHPLAGLGLDGLDFSQF